MDNIVTRKCTHCKGEIEIDKNNITGVIQFQNKYYHYDCFESTATQKASSKRGKPKMWQEALDNIWTIEEETKQILAHIIAKDDLNTWLLDHYDISVVPSYFWQLVADLENGTYKQKKCKPIKTKQLYNMWVWGQKHLDKIAMSNKRNRKGPTSDNDRLRYDLAILLGHQEDYKKHLVKAQVQEIERQQRQKENIQVDYNKIKTINTNSGLGDISDLLDDII